MHNASTTLNKSKKAFKIGICHLALQDMARILAYNAGTTFNDVAGINSP